MKQHDEKTRTSFEENLLKRLEEKEEEISDMIHTCERNIEVSKKDYCSYDRVSSAVTNVKFEQENIKLYSIQRKCLNNLIDVVRLAIKDTSKN